MAGRTEKWSATRQLALLDLKSGDVVQHTPGRTITEFDDVFATLLCVNRAPLHIDANYSEKTAQGQRIVNGLFITAIAMGLANRDFRPNPDGLLAANAISHHAPTYYGDTLYAASTVKSVERTGEAAVDVRVDIEVFNQRNELVLRIDRTYGGLELHNRQARAS